MEREQSSTTAQLRDDIDKGSTGSKVAASDPAASPLGTDDEAAGTPPSGDRIEMARKAEQKIGGAADRTKEAVASDDALSQRGSNAPYAKEDHMNTELATRHAEQGTVKR